MRIKFIIILILLAGNLPAQSDTSSASKPAPGKLTENKMNHSPLTLIKDYHFINFYSPGLDNISMNPNTRLSLYAPKEAGFIQMKQNIALGFEVMNAAKKRKSLGVFGKFLGYTNAAAAIGLAAYHFSKYGWDGNKQKKKKD